MAHSPSEQLLSMQGFSQEGRTDPRSQEHADSIFSCTLSTQSSDPISTGTAVINVLVPLNATNLGLSSTDS